MSSWFSKLQAVGKALMLPVAVLNCTPKVGQKTTFGGAVFL